MPIMAQPFEHLDHGHAAYCSVLFVEVGRARQRNTAHAARALQFTHSHPVLLTFCHQLAEAQALRGYEAHQELIYASTLPAGTQASTRRRRVRNRLWLMITLRRNPSLAKLRKRRLATSLPSVKRAAVGECIWMV